jgi:hypothetical protein
MREGTTSRVMTADRPYGEFYDFYSVSPEYFGYYHVLPRSFSSLARGLLRRLGTVRWLETVPLFGLFISYFINLH